MGCHDRAAERRTREVGKGVLCRWTDSGNPYACMFLRPCAYRSIGVSNFNVHHLEELKKVRPHNIPASECVVHLHSVTVKQCA